MAVKWSLEEPHDRGALASLRSGERLVAPELIVTGIVNVVFKRVTTAAIELAQAADVPRAIPKSLAELCRWHPSPHALSRSPPSCAIRLTIASAWPLPKRWTSN